MPNMGEHFGFKFTKKKTPLHRITTGGGGDSGSPVSGLGPKSGRGFIQNAALCFNTAWPIML